MIVVIIIASFFIFLLALGIHAQFKRQTTGKEGIVGEIGSAKTDITKDGGSVFVHGEYWNAVSEKKIRRGSKVKIVGVKEMVLNVEEAAST
jgi:membrane-bound serine protease (ClpP class)